MDRAGGRPASRLDALAVSPWFGDVVILALCASILGFAALMTPSEEALSLFGIEIPVMCSFRRFFGIPCPGCGMTRSFVFLAHGHPLIAFRMNPVGPLLFALVASQVPWRIGSLWRRRAREDAPPPS